VIAKKKSRILSLDELEGEVVDEAEYKKKAGLPGTVSRRACRAPLPPHFLQQHPGGNLPDAGSTTSPYYDISEVGRRKAGMNE
jgi:hypothetical protein